MHPVSFIREFCEETGYSFYGDYSGRGMYGRKCVGFVADADKSLFTVGLELASFAYDNGIEISELIDELGRACEDTMGLGKIVYFPDLDV